MKLPNFKRIYKTDFKAEYQDLIEQLASIINIGFTQLYDLSNNKINLTDNIAATVKTLDLSANNGTPNITTSFQVPSSTKILGITVLQATNLTNSNNYPISGPFISYTQSDKNVTITNITGLQNNEIYRIVVVAWGA